MLSSSILTSSSRLVTRTSEYASRVVCDQANAQEAMQAERIIFTREAYEIISSLFYNLHFPKFSYSGHSPDVPVMDEVCSYKRAPASTWTDRCILFTVSFSE